MENHYDIGNTFDEQFTKHLSQSWSRTVSLRRHKKRLETYGEFSFQVPPDWCEDGNSNAPDDEQQTSPKKSEEAGISEKALAGILEASKTWALVITRCQLKEGRVCVYLDKIHAFRSALHTILTLKECYGRCPSNNKEMTVLTDILLQNLDLTEWRVLLMRDVITRLLQAVGYIVLKDGTAEREHIHVTTKLSAACNSVCTRLSVGVVLDTGNRRRGHMYAQEYLKMRYADIQRAAEHKCDFITDSSVLKHLTEASVKMDLLYVKASHTVSINKVTCNKGACFVLYNCARLAAIMKHFEDKVAAGYYPPLVPFSEVDISKLNKEEEWEMLFVYLVAYPDIVKQAALSPNHICSFILSLCSTFSVYYRRVRILTEPRSQLLPVMFARLYLLQGIQHVLHNALSLLDIAPVTCM